MTDVAKTTEGGRVAALGVPPKQLAPAWVALVVLAALAWVVTIDQANGMGIGPGTITGAALSVVATGSAAASSTACRFAGIGATSPRSSQ